MGRRRGILQGEYTGQRTTQTPRVDKTRRIAGLRKMGLQNEHAFGYAGQEVEKLAGPVQMVEQTAAEDGIEGAVHRDFPDVVADKFEVRQRNFRLNVPTSLDVRFTYIEAQCLKAQPGEFHAVASLEAA